MEKTLYLRSENLSSFEFQFYCLLAEQFWSRHLTHLILKRLISRTGDKIHAYQDYYTKQLKSSMWICWLNAVQYQLVQFSHSVVSDSLWPHESQQARPPCPSPTPGVHSNSCPSSWWCHPAISSSVVPFSSCPQSLPASGSLPVSQFFTWGGQSIGVSALTSVLPMSTQDWSPWEWTGWITLQFKGLSRVFSNTTIQKHQFFGAQLSSQSNSHIHTWLLEKP